MQLKRLAMHQPAVCYRWQKECDEVLFDLKIMDVRLAREIINMNLPRVLANLRLLVEQGINVIPRLPLIPGFTMNVDNTQYALVLLSSLGIKQIHLLPFINMANRNTTCSACPGR